MINLGLYDKLAIWSSCPYCGEEKTRYGQTKDVSCLLEHFSTVTIRDKKWFSSQKELKGYGWVDENLPENTKAPNNLKYVSVILTCNSPICEWDWMRYSILIFGQKWGSRERFWYAKIPIEEIEGVPRFIDKPFDLEFDFIFKEKRTKKQLSGYKKKMNRVAKSKFVELMKKYKNEFLALYYL